MNSTWPEFEITEIPPLKDDESRLLDMHSMLNILSILHGEMALVGLSLAHDEELLKQGLTACRGMISGLRQHESLERSLFNLAEFRELIEKDLNGALEKYPAGRADHEVQESLENIQSVFRILEVRAREILARLRAPEAWIPINIDKLRGNFFDVFSAIERNSKGRYHIIYNLARQTEKDYFISFNIDSESIGTVTLPLVFIDVMRDLIANARKYTPLGGSLTAGLYEDKDLLRFVVQDTGRGIPENEIPVVVQFGKRGSNVGAVRTMGGGFGLTKAFLVTKQFKGRMWIASRVGEGTRIRIEISRASAAAA